MTTKNKMIMDFAVKHVVATKVNIAELKIINKVRKYKRVMLTHEILCYRGVALTACGRAIN